MYLHAGVNRVVNVMVSFDHIFLAPLTTLSWVLSDHLVLVHQMSARLQLALASLRTRVPSWQEGEVPWGAWSEVFSSCLFWTRETLTLFLLTLDQKCLTRPTAAHCTSFDPPAIHKITTRWQHYPITALSPWSFISEF